MSFASGVFSINTAGQPVVTGTVISSTAFNAFTADIGTGLSTCILKDGTQTATASVPFAQGITVGGIFTVSAAGVVTGNASMLSPITNSLAGDVAMNNTSNYFTGPTVAQGTSGTWFASGTVTLYDTTAGASVFSVKLWDGTTVIASALAYSPAANSRVVLSLSGYLTTPAGNIRISVKDGTNATGVIAFNDSGNSKDGTLTAIRIG